MSEISDLVRKDFGEGDRARDKGLTTPDSIIRYDDIRYGDDPQWQVLDVYRPRNMDGKVLPVIVSVHGGAWVYGTKEVYQFYCMSLAERGFAVVNFTYRLAPEYKFPSSLEDTNAVFNWIINNANTYGFDTDNIFAVGDSAGAHILGLYAAACTNPEYASGYDFIIPNNFVPRAIALNCGTYEITLDNNSPDDSTALIMKDFLPKGGEEDEMLQIRVTEHISDDFPPSFIMTSNDDFLKHQAPIMAEALTKKEIPFVYRMYGTKEKPLSHVFHCNVRLEEASLCNQEECSFFKSFIK